MHVRLAFGTLLMLGMADLAYLDLHLAPQLALQRATQPLSTSEVIQPPSSGTPPRIEASSIPSVVAAAPIASTAAVAAIDAPSPAVVAAKPPSDTPSAVAPGSSSPNEAIADIPFDLDSNRINYLPSIVVLREVAGKLSREPSRRLLVRGHSDQMGSSGYKHALSLQRATTVRAYLISHGAPADRITVEEVGDSEPVDVGSNPIAWAKNRRVQLLWH